MSRKKFIALYLAALTMGTIALGGPRFLVTGFSAHGMATAGPSNVLKGQRNLMVQCPPSADTSGIPQMVYLRAGFAGQTIDAGPSTTGPGDVIADFTSSNDPFPFGLAANEDRIFIRQTDAGPVSCGVYVESTP